MKYGFNVDSGFAVTGIVSALAEMRFNVSKDVVLCIGTDSVIGDSLAPLVASILKRENVEICVYGTLNEPVRANDVEKCRRIIKNMHPNSRILTIDAAVGRYEDIGMIKVIDGGIRPGLGVSKEMDEIGDMSIIGIVSERKDKNVGLTLARLGLVYKMAGVISDGLRTYFECA